MDLREWSTDNAGYGRRLLDSGIQGARSGQQTFLKGERLTPFLGESARHALKHGAMGVVIGVLAGYPSRQKSLPRALTYGLLGGAIGLCAGLVWESRSLTASMAGSALKNIGKVRDERWLAKHPIDYA